MKIGIVGLGKMGEYHIRKYQSLPNMEVYGMDINTKRTVSMGRKYNIFGVPTIQSFIDEIDAVSICTPPDTHYDIAKEFLLKGKPILLEKPMTGDYKLYKELLGVAKSQDCILQPGLTEVYNPAITSLISLAQNPISTITSRFVPSTTRTADVNIVLDLMIHDLAILFQLHKENPTTVYAKGTHNKIHAWLVFPEGQTAHLVAARTFVNINQRQILVLTEDGEYFVDCQDQTLAYKQNTIPYTGIDSLSREILAFLSSIKTGTKPITTGLQALKYANQIKDMI